MDNEPYRVLDHTQAIAELVAMTLRLGGTSIAELVLPDGRRADLAWLDPQGDLLIFEVKSEYKASLAASAYEKYYRWCNYLWLAVPNMTAQKFGLDQLQRCDFPSSDKVGIMGIYPASTAVFFPPRRHQLIGEKRLAMLRLFPEWPADR